MAFVVIGMEVALILEGSAVLKATTCPTPYANAAVNKTV
jgi:hypothetical protein